MERLEIRSGKNHVKTEAVPNGTKSIISNLNTLSQKINGLTNAVQTNSEIQNKLSDFVMEKSNADKNNNKKPTKKAKSTKPKRTTKHAKRSNKNAILIQMLKAEKH